VGFKESVNRALRRTTGYQLQRQTPRRRPDRLGSGDRLLESPVFIMCTVRSGSTLLRVLLNSHSEIHSPHELHLRHIRARARKGYPEKALREIGLDNDRLRHLLWDRVLHRELMESGKQILVNKTPSDVFIADEILGCWPDARFIFLLRHPASIAKSRHAARPQDEHDRNIGTVLRYGNALEEVRRAQPGLTVRYEDIAADPAKATRDVCAFLGVRWEQQMLDYGRFAHGPHKVGLGDWSEKIKSGRVQPPKPPPPIEEIPPELLDLTRAWGYLPSSNGAGPDLAVPAKPPVETA
jgi:Sulfotransferase family